MRFEMILAAVATAVIGARASANVVTIGASHDATIYSGSPGNSNGAGPGIFTGTDGSQTIRGLMAFDIFDNVPPGATITGVQLSLTLGMVAGGGGGNGGGPDTQPRAIELHRVTNSWGEGTTLSGTTTIAPSGQGVAANSGDATWNARSFSSTTPTLWTTPGGDFVAAASGSDVVGHTVGEVDQWLSTAGMVADVQSWFDTPSGNNGWALINTDETDKRTLRAYWTREAPVPSNQPQLQITFTPVPEPMTLSAVGAIGLLLRRRREAQ